MSDALRFMLALPLLAGAFAAACAQDAPAERQQIKIGFVEIENDPRYEPVRAYERIILKTRAHPFTGAAVGVDEAAALARVLKADFMLERIAVKSAADVAPAVLAALDAGTHFFLLDAPTEALSRSPRQSKGATFWCSTSPSRTTRCAATSARANSCMSIQAARS